MKSSLFAMVALAGTFIVSVPEIAAAENTLGRVYRGIDDATGARVAVTLDPGVVSVTVEHPSVTIRKELRDGLTITRMKAGREELALTLSRSRFVVSGSRGRIDAGAAHPERVSAAQALIASSAAARLAETLIGRLTIAPGSPLRHSLLATRTLILTASGRADLGADPARGTRVLRTATVAAGTSMEDEGPGNCWFEYAKEAIDAYLEYEQCMAGEQWWDLLGQAACAVIYEMRAIGAFSWWVSCVGLRG
jgi:hypothetical protein